MSAMIDDILDKCRTLEEVVDYMDRAITMCDEIIDKIQRSKDKYVQVRTTVLNAIAKRDQDANA